MSEPRTGQTDPTRAVRLGPFVLQEPVGRGGMGLVWRGWHHERGVPVAVKIMDTKVADTDIDRTFRNEVQAVARLDHPGVVWVYDVGQVDRTAAESSRGRLTTGCPYIAMEYASRGTLKDWGRLPWEGTREVLLALLDALSHAHARGVIHRDLKPANVLVCGPEDLRQGLKLADFGIAHAMEQFQGTDPGKSQKTAIGTVQYMAPEQIRVEHQDTGAWTDIYALGNVTWQLLTGKVPFSNYSGVALVRAQLEEPLPEPTGMRLPDGFVEWLRRCVAKNPQDRFQRCADAAEALLELGASRDELGRPVEVFDHLPTIRVELKDDGVTTNPVDAGDQSGVQLHTGLVSLTMMSPKSRSGAAGPTTTGQVARKVPPEWRRPDLPRPSFSLLGAGLALYDVRQPPLVGRLEELDLLWEALRGVAKSGRPDLVLISGPTGIGKSRLARFLCERAHELGAATPLTARFFEEDSEDGAIRRMWARYLRMGEVEPSQRARWLVKILARHGLSEPERFAILVGPGPADRRRDQSEVMIRAMTRDRPVVLVLDDVDAGDEGIELAQRLMRAARPLPLLVVLCARSEVLGQTPERRAVMDGLAARHHRIDLGPLPPRHAAALVEEVLGLSPALAAQVTERTGGNPRFARKLIGDWVKRGVLVLGPTGFEVRRGEVLELPASLRDVWAERIESILRGMPEKAPVLLERAAVLGLEVDEREWQRACDDPEGGWAAAGRQRLVPDNERNRKELLQRLQAVRLLEPMSAPGAPADAPPTGFRFATGMIREVLLERAKAGGRWAEHHRACATVLRYNDDPEASAERVGRHLLEAGAVEESIEPLLQGVVFRRDRVGARSALGLVATAEDGLRALRLDERDPRWGEAWQLRAMLTAELGEVAEAERVAQKVIDREALPGWAPHALDARTTIARMKVAQGELEVAERELERVETTSTDPVQQGLAAAERALIAARLRDRDRARERTDAAIRLLRRAASSRALAECWRVVGTTALLLRNERQAEDALARGLRLYKLRGNVVGQADCLSGLGRSAILRGELEQAEDRLVEAIHLFEVAGTGEVVRPKTDLARVRIERGRFEEGRDLLHHVRHALSRQGRTGVVEGLGALQLAAAAGLQDWDEFDHRCRLIEADPANEVGEDGRWGMEQAIRLANAAGKTDRATRAREQLDSLPRTTGRAPRAAG